MGPQNTIGLFLILANGSDSNRSRGVERGLPVLPVQVSLTVAHCCSLLLTVAHLCLILTHSDSHSITRKAALLIFPNRNRFYTGEDSGQTIGCSLTQRAVDCTPYLEEGERKMETKATKSSN